MRHTCTSLEAIRLVFVTLLWCSVSAARCTAADAPETGDSGRRPLIAVIGENDGTEVTDFVIPYGVLSASGVADVVDVSVHSGPLHMMPVMTIEAKESIASFDAKHPGGADYVIVPAVHRSTDETLIKWVQAQAHAGATIVGVCDGVWVVGRAGLLENRVATGHWYSRSGLAGEFPHTRWVRDRRYVEDGPLITTTGVTASLPVSLALVERIGGADRAAALARELGVSSWAPVHRSDDFQLTARHAATAAVNWLEFWRYDRIGIPITAGVDEISLSFTGDALGRTYRSTVFTVGDGERIVSKRGLTIIPDRRGDAADLDRVDALPPAGVPPAQSLDRALDTITRAYGPNTAKFVALQIEYPWRGP
jgi:putative intracellular protease/amidase